jgi:hypothetical protein
MKILTPLDPTVIPNEQTMEYINNLRDSSWFKKGKLRTLLAALNRSREIKLAKSQQISEESNSTTKSASVTAKQEERRLKTIKKLLTFESKEREDGAKPNEVNNNSSNATKPQQSKDYWRRTQPSLKRASDSANLQQAASASRE